MLSRFWGVLATCLVLPLLVWAQSTPDQTAQKPRVDLPNAGKLRPYLRGFNFPRLRKIYELRTTGSSTGFVQYAQNFKDHPNLKKIIVFQNPCNLSDFSKMPKSKLLYFSWEAATPLYIYDYFSTVYTFDDDLVDGVKFFKFYYPVLTPMRPELPSFEEKKLCVMITSHWTPKRVEMVTFFDTKPKGDFEFYGRLDWRSTREEKNKMKASHCYQGHLPGSFSNNIKFATLARYRFCVCFENHQDVKGYISEKIFHCFAAGCVPIYFGPENVEDYIPKECFIDYRDFKSNEELYQFIKNMPKERYEQYIENIRLFLESPQAHLFSLEHFEQTLDEAINR
jgi:hypothetical protein